MSKDVRRAFLHTIPILLFSLLLTGAVYSICLSVLPLFFCLTSCHYALAYTVKDV